MNLLLHTPALLIVIPLLAAFIVPFIDKISSKARNAFVLIIVIAEEIMMLIFAAHIFSGNIAIYTMGAGNPAKLVSEAAVPIRIALEVDAMGAFMGLISVTVTMAAAIYSISFIEESKGKGKFYTLLLIMLVGMLGMEFTGDLFNMFVFLEILSIASCALVAYRNHDGNAVEGAFKYMVVSNIAALFVLFSIALLYSQYDLLNIAALSKVISYTDLDKIALVLLATSFAMKAGSVPMHFWAPDSYSMAPASITAMLVSASQASLYALFRVSFTLYGKVITASSIGIFLIALGLLSMFIGVTMALPQKDIKRLMAYHAVSQTGYMLLGVGVGLYLLGSPEFNTYGIKAMEGGIFHIINHAMYKGLLFLTAGAIFYRLKTRNLNKMGGLAHSMKWTSIFFIIGALSIAGIPPFNGFASKLLIYEAAYRVSPILSIIAMIVSILTLASFVKVFHSAFMGPKIYDAEEAPKSMLAGMAVLAFVIILFSIIPGLVVDKIVAPAANALANWLVYSGGV